MRAVNGGITASTRPGCHEGVSNVHAVAKLKDPLLDGLPQVQRCRGMSNQICGESCESDHCHRLNIEVCWILQGLCK